MKIQIDRKINNMIRIMIMQMIHEDDDDDT